jgi:DNA-binding SARP family transcriptional activator/tetratricopeptide (TPR) repeat protein
MEFRILGPLEVHVYGDVLRLSGRRQHTLAALLVNPNRVVPLASLVDATWDDDPPTTAKRQIQNSLSDLRRHLQGAADAPVIVADGPGYRLRLATHQLDALVFDDLVAQAQTLADDQPERAVSLLRSALHLWRGPALAGCSGRILEAAAARLTERYLAAGEQCRDLELALGRQHELIGELSEIVATHPLRERTVGQLMLALSRAGRQAEALHAFHRLRTRLADELGVDPSARLIAIYTAVLRGEASTAGRSPGSSEPVGSRAVVPRQLPAPTRHFTGRERELKELDNLADTTDQAPGVVIAAIAGPAGVGKTTTAVYWAHQVAHRFPDGQLYVNLRGFDPTTSAMTPAEAIRGFLDALAVPAARIPANLHEQAALYRSILADRRMLVVLDNAGDADQVRPLLPGSGTSLALITSRNRLSGLVATHGAHPMSLNLLDGAAAHELLSRRLGDGRTGAEPAAVGRIVTRCAGLPLALAVIAARAATNPGVPLTVLADDLHRTQRHLDAFNAGDPASDVRAVLSWSYRQLQPEQARMFRLLGLHAGPDITPPAAASLAAVPLTEASLILTGLAQVHLATETDAGRYSMHDLLHAYATELVQTDEADDRHTALHRLLDHYGYTANAAALRLNPHRDPSTAPVPMPGVLVESIRDHDEALAWFTREHAVLLAAIGRAAEEQFDHHVVQLTWALPDFLQRRGRWHDWVTTYGTALHSARRLADPGAQARTHRGLGRAYYRLDQDDDAETHLRHALDLYRESQDRAGQAHTHLSLSWVMERRGRLTDALHHAEQAQQQYEASNERAWQAQALNALSRRHAQLGNDQQAIVAATRACELHHELDNRAGEADAWDSLGVAHDHAGQHRRAIPCYRRAAQLYRELSAHVDEAETLVRLGHAHHGVGEQAAGDRAWQHALSILDRLDHPGADEVRALLVR